MKDLLLLCLIIPQISFAMIGLKVGDKAPNLNVKATEGKVFKFSKSIQTTIAVYYRWAWCPYYLKQLKDIQSEFVSKVGKAQVVKSVDKLKIAKKMKINNKFSLKVLTDLKAKS